MVSIIKLTVGLLLIVVIAAGGAIATNHYYPEKLPKKAQQIIKQLVSTSNEKLEESIPGYADSVEEKMKKQIKENARIAKEELGKLQRITQQKTEYEFNKAFEKWYAVSKECLNPNSSNTLNYCANLRRRAKEEFKNIWKPNKDE